MNGLRVMIMTGSCFKAVKNHVGTLNYQNTAFGNIKLWTVYKTKILNAVGIQICRLM